MAKLRLTIDYPSDITRDRRVHIFRIRRMIEFIVEFIAVPEVHSSAWWTSISNVCGRLALIPLTRFYTILKRARYALEFYKRIPGRDVSAVCIFQRAAARKKENRDTAKIRQRMPRIRRNVIFQRINIEWINPWRKNRIDHRRITMSLNQSMRSDQALIN